MENNIQVGTRVGILTIIGYRGNKTYPNSQPQKLVEVRCDCGETSVKPLFRVVNHEFKFCTKGCKLHVSNLPGGKKIFTLWKKLKKDSDDSVWKDPKDFYDFVARNFAEITSSNFTLVRKKFDEPYSPENVLLVPMSQSHFKFYTIGNRTMPIRDFMKELGITRQSFDLRRKSGMSIEQALTKKPPKKLPKSDA